MNLVRDITHKVMIDSARFIDMLGNTVKIPFPVPVIKCGTLFAFAPAETVVRNHGDRPD